jgi:hypothetical protein
MSLVLYIILCVLVFSCLAADAVNVRQKTLLLCTTSNAYELDAYTTALELLNAYDVPYTAYTNAAATELPSLTDTSGLPLYSAVVLCCTTSVTTIQRTTLNTYRSTYGIRSATVYAIPGAVSGTTPVTSPINTNTEVVLLSSANNMGYLKNDAHVPLTSNDPFIPYPYTYSTTIASTLRVTVLATFQNGLPAIVRYNNTISKYEWDDVHIFVQCLNIHMHSFALAALWMPWVHHNEFVGVNTMYLTPHIDDLYIETETVINKLKVRCSSADIDALASKQVQLNSQILPGSFIKSAFAFNAAGIDEHGGFVGDELVTSTREHCNNFEWMSHTFRHALLTNLTYATVLEELASNEIYANALFVDCPQNYDFLGMVTPEISGIYNKDALQAIYDTGKRVIVGDNSIIAYVPANRYHAYMTTTAVNGFAGIAVVPRFATEMYFNCADPDEEVIFFNNQTWNPVKMTYPEILQMEAFRTARGVLALRRDAYMFHQGNIKLYDGANSMLSDWLSAVVDYISPMINVPIRSLRLDDAGEMALKKMARDSSSLQIVVEYLDVVDGAITIKKPRSLTFRCDKAVEVPLVGYDVVAHPNVRKEAFGNHYINYVTVPANTDVLVYVMGAQVCGNGVRDVGEDCDSGIHCTYCKCDASCVPVSTTSIDCSYVASCGNNIRDIGEDCDGGANCNSTCKCPYSYAPVSATSIDCVYVPQCGNKIRDIGEDCDSGTYCTACKCNYSYSPTSATSIDCVYVPQCGNKIRDAGEDCDNGTKCTNCKCDPSHVPLNLTSVDCLYVPQCGNKIRDIGEECDNGTYCSACKCNYSCAPVSATSIDCIYLASCGNKLRDANEDCDGGSNCKTCKCDFSYVPVNATSIDCVYAAYCGNKIRDVGEECDNGTKCTNCKCDPSYGPIDGTSVDCIYVPQCGNKIHDPGEDCDSDLHCTKCKCDLSYIPYNTTGTECKYVPQCGNKIRDQDEECDGGEHCTACKCDFSYTITDDTSINCTYVPYCGNKIKDPNEDCDSCAYCTLCKCDSGYYSPDLTNKCVVYVPQCGNNVVDLNEDCEGGLHCTPNCTCESREYQPTEPPSAGCVIRTTDTYLLSPSTITNEYGSCVVPDSGIGCLGYAEQVGTQNTWGTYISCNGPYSGQFRVQLPSDITSRNLIDMKLLVNYRAASVVNQRAEWFVKRPRDSTWIRLFTTGDMCYIYSWMWKRYDSGVLPTPLDLIETEILNNYLYQYVTFRYVVSSGKPEPTTQLDLFLLAVKVNYTMLNDVSCGNGWVDVNEECDGGLGCIGCKCATGMQSTIPLSIDCEAIVAPVNGSWSSYPSKFLTRYGHMDMPDDGVMCLRTKDQLGREDLWGTYVEMVGPYVGDYIFVLPPDARSLLTNLQLTVNYRGTDMTRQRAVWYIKDKTTNTFVKLFSLFDIPYCNSWTWEEHVHKISSNCDKYIELATGEVTIRFVVELGKPEPAALFDFFELKAERLL